MRVIEPRGIVHRNADVRRARFERSDSLFCVTPLSLRVPFRGRGPLGFHRSENKALPCTAATTETRKIVSVSMPVLNSILPCRLHSLCRTPSSALD